MPQTVASGALLPPQGQNQIDGSMAVGLDRLARECAERHARALRRRRYRDLTAEKYMLHIDGEGDAQWADIYRGQRVVIPPHLSGGPRTQNNVLRPLVDNSVAYHTHEDFRFAVPTPVEAANRDTALVDTVFANHQSRVQRWNDLFTEALYFAHAYGNCPVHVYWRDDVTEDLYEGLWSDPDVLYMLPRGGMLDAWVGDPFSSTYNAGATATSVERFTYERVVSGDLVRKMFAHIPGAENLEGTSRLPSASRFQRIARKWIHGSRDVHGTAVIQDGEHSDEMIGLICDELAPGVDPQYPEGRLIVAALQGAASTDEGEGGRFTNVRGLHVGPLPAGTFSAVRAYSMGRYDDVLGKAYVADIDDLQMQLNQLETLENEFIRRSVHAPYVTPEGVDLETFIWEDDAEIEIDPMTRAVPFYLELPSRWIPLLENKVERVKEDMFRIGGWMAASRGESHAGDSGKKVIALARADDTVHGPTNKRFRGSVEAFAGLNHRLAKEYAEEPMLVEALGEEAGYLAEPWIDRDRLSDSPPAYRLVSGFGATPEAKAEQLVTLVTTQGVDGKPLMTTDEFRAQWPDASTYPERDNPQVLRDRRPRVVNEAIQRLARHVLKSNPQLDQVPVGHPVIQELAFVLNLRIDAAFPVLLDDDVVAHISTLSMLTQDETERALTRALASSRQQLYYRWAAQQMQQAAAAQAGGAMEGGRRGGPGLPSPASAAGTPTSSSLELASNENPM